MNRLHLNFQLDSADERQKFLAEYVEREEFYIKPPTNEELETMGNYLLWGKDENGKNSVQNKLVEIKTKNGTWDKQEDESLDALIESPSFNEANISGLTSPRIKIARENFDRTKALSSCPPSLIPIFKELFLEIDKLDLTLNYWDLAHGKRKNPPREELLNKFSEEEQNQLKEESTHWNQFKYLKKRHLLVELRRQQFSLKDSYTTQIQKRSIPIYEQFPDDISFETEIEVFPLGVNSKNSKFSQLIFREEFVPESYSEKELEEISKFYWKKKNLEGAPSTKKFIIDFRELEHVYNLFLMYFDLEDEAMKNELESETDSLLRTLKYYIKKADLSNTQKEILTLKMKKIKNQDIADYINGKYGNSYTANYISTIFRQKIIKQINEAARFHIENIGNIFFSENFKRCTACGKMILKCPDNFVRKTRSKDGYSNKCKKCDKLDRERRKEAKQNANS